MRIVVDTNVLISALIARSITYEIILFGNLELYTPEYSLEEIERNEKMLREKMEVSTRELEIVLASILKYIKIIPRIEYKEFEKEAEKVSPDYKDFPFFALALAKQLPLWSNEKKLKEQNHIRVYNTKEIVSLIN